MKSLLNVVVVIALITSLAFATNAKDQREVEKQKIIISTDNGFGLSGGWRDTPTDPADLLALFYAMNSNKIDVLGISTMFGAPYGVASYQATKHAFDLLAQRDPNRKLPGIYQGATRPLDLAATTLYPHKTPLDPQRCVNPGVKFMHESIMKHKNVELVSIGPLTDIACLLKTYPEVMSGGHLKKIVAMMGRPTHKNKDGELVGENFFLNGRPGVTGFVFLKDPTAAKIVLEQNKVPVKLVTFSVTGSVWIPKADITKAYESGHKDALSKFLYGTLGQWTTYFNKVIGVNGFYPWDVQVINAVVNPQEYTCEKAGYKVVPCSGKDNVCAGHKGTVFAGNSMAKESAQLWFSKEYKDTAQHSYCTKFSSSKEAVKNFFDQSLSEF